ncbi:protease modulator HflC [Marinagarivorans cellulosilyticus]|uniref:Protein HflC n=1 Tax=Marinagarivorans cellulosilyticus TaxID=2721545 RepID=A0AAN1WFG1_9GAMM|nr:protease modulator HflC [Marinagarivorans cellulosilyticus]BCD96638.1 membrane protease subunit HflC [Marinagarivorans cellulosilyticus]
MSTKSLMALVGGLLIVIVAANSLYIVNEFERGVELRLGRVSNGDLDRGLHVKFPFVDSVKKFDGRIMTLDAPAEPILTVEKKTVEVDSYAKWRILDVKKFYTATNGEIDRARSLLSQRINEELRNQFALRSLHEVVSGQRDELMLAIKDELNKFSDTSLGIEVVDVRVKRIDLPVEVSGPVFERMRAERELEAAQHRAEGEKMAKITRADADRKARVERAKAYRDAEKIKGEGDAIAADTYAKAYNQDSEFYAFVRSLEAYRATFAQKQDVMLVDPASDFFRYFKSANGDAAKGVQK